MCPSATNLHVERAGLLTSGLIPAVRHALHNLLTHDAIVMPSSATVFVQARNVPTMVPLEIWAECWYDSIP